jgi:predicted RNA-binding Zn-ribbon protein involved in translation (DUF1610 family)
MAMKGVRPVGVGVLVIVAGIAVWLLFLRGTGDEGTSSSSDSLDWHVLCEACSAARPVTQKELVELFPFVGLEASPKPAVCPECGKRTLRRAVKCPKDGTVFVLPTGTDPTRATCPKCGWTLKSERATD